MPATFAIGVAYTWDRLTVAADADWTFWSRYKSLPITIKDTVPPYLVSTNAVKNWEDVCAFRLGADDRATTRLALRAGVVSTRPRSAETMGAELPDSDGSPTCWAWDTVGRGRSISPHVHRQDGSHVNTQVGCRR